MNYLAHLYLADHTHTSVAGSVLGDAVKGRLRGEYPAAIELGIHLHRRIDSFTDSHSLVLAACAQFEPPYRRYAGILLDIYFDFLLTQQWASFHHEPLSVFATRISAKIWKQWPHPPLTHSRLSGFPDVLLSYGREDGVRTALRRVSERASRANPMVDALPLLQSKHDVLEQTFNEFFPDLIEFVEREAAEL